MGSNNHHNILSPVSLGIDKTDGSAYNVQINQNLIKNNDGRYETTGIFILFSDNFGLEKNDFYDLTQEDVHELADNKNPDYLGRILFDEKGHWIYDGDYLSIMEQEQIAEFISTYEDGDVSY